MKSKMENAKYAIVYLAYGLDTNKYQAVISIYTLLYHLDGVSDDFIFIIYTDKNHAILDKYLQDVPIKIEVVTKQQAQEFKGPTDYVFRLKPSVIKDYFSKYKQNLLYMDTDTFFLHNPTSLLQRIAPGYSLMNAEDYNFVDGGIGEPDHWFTMRKWLKGRKYTVNGQQTLIPISTMMWNAGIIGLSQADSKLVDQIISLNDEMYSQCRTFIVEQFVTSYVLQTATQLNSTEDYIDHYWPKEIKNSFNLRIPGFLKENGSKPRQELYALAFEFAQKVRQIATPYRAPLLTKVRTRLELIMQVAWKGHL